jgi:predicted nucleotidyltransferase
MTSSATSLLETLRRRSAAARTLALAHAETIRQTVIAAVKNGLPLGGRAWVIGSLAWGEFGVRSDIDLVFENVPDRSLIDIEMSVSRATALAVDVLRLRDLPPDFRARVLREGLAIHGA